MNKKIIFIIILLFAGISLFLMDYFSSATSDSYESEGIVEDSKPVKEFKNFCDEMGDKSWNKEKYTEQKNKLKVFKDQSVITSSQQSQLEEYMNYRYARSLVKGFEEWKRNCDGTTINTLFSEMKNISQYPGCQNILNPSIRDINIYFQILNSPEKINRHLSREFDDGENRNLLSQLQSAPRYFYSCPKTKQALESGINRLSEFKNYAIQFKNAINLYRLNRSDFYNRQEMINMCPDRNAQTNKYNYYRNEIDRLNVCN